MCLKNAIPCDGNGNMVGYKVLARNSKGEFTSVVNRDYVYMIGPDYINYAEGELEYVYQQVRKGALFMFKEKKDAIFYLHMLQNTSPSRYSDFYLAECLVPDNTPNCLIGKQEIFNDQYDNWVDAVGYASPRMTITRIIF